MSPWGGILGGSEGRLRAVVAHFELRRVDEKLIRVELVLVDLDELVVARARVVEVPEGEFEMLERHFGLRALRECR